MIGENTSATSMRVPFVDQRNASRAKYKRGDEKENDWMDVEATRTRTIFFFLHLSCKRKASRYGHSNFLAHRHLLTQRPWKATMVFCSTWTLLLRLPRKRIRTSLVMEARKNAHACRSPRQKMQLQPSAHAACQVQEQAQGHVGSLLPQSAYQKKAL